MRLSGRFDDADALHDEVQRLKQQAETFNSTFVVGADSRLRAVYPSNLALGTLLATTGTREALRERRPLMSLPFVSATGRLIIMLSQPIYAPDGSYLGFLGGSLYLKERAPCTPCSASTTTATAPICTWSTGSAAWSTTATPSGSAR